MNKVTSEWIGKDLSLSHELLDIDCQLYFRRARFEYLGNNEFSNNCALHTSSNKGLLLGIFLLNQTTSDGGS